MSAQPAPASDFGDALRTGLEALPSSHQFASNWKCCTPWPMPTCSSSNGDEALNLFAFLSQYGPTRRPLRGEPGAVPAHGGAP